MTIGCSSAVEHRIVNPKVGGSNPPARASKSWTLAASLLDDSPEMGVFSADDRADELFGFGCHTIEDVMEGFRMYREICYEM